MARKMSAELKKIRNEYIHSDKSIKQLAKEYNREPGYIYTLSSKEGWTQQKREFLDSLQAEANTEIKRMYINAVCSLFKKNLEIYSNNLDSLSQIPVMEDRDRVNLAVKLPQILLKMQEIDPEVLKVKVEETNGLDRDSKKRLDKLISEVHSLCEAQIDEEEEEEDA